MNRYAISLLAFAMLVLVFAVALHRAPEKRVVPSALIGKAAPDFELPDLLNPGSTVKGSTFKGRWHLVNVWGTWCAECKAEHQSLLDIKGEGKVVIVGINYQEKNDDDPRKWLKDLGNPYEAVGVDRQGRTAMDFGVYGAPENYLVNPQGIVVARVFGLTPDSWRELRKKFVEAEKP